MVKNKTEITEGVTVESLDSNIEGMGGEVRITLENLDSIIKEMGGEISVYKIEFRILWIGPLVTRYNWEARSDGNVAESGIWHFYRTPLDAWMKGASKFLKHHSEYEAVNLTRTS